MDISVRVKNTSFEIKADSYEITPYADYKRYGNGYIDVSKVYPQTNCFYYECALLIKYISRPYRFHFSNKYTKLFISEIEEPDLINFCKLFRNYHVVKIECGIIKYTIPTVYKNKKFYMLCIKNLYAEEN